MSRCQIWTKGWLIESKVMAGAKARVRPRLVTASSQFSVHNWSLLWRELHLKCAMIYHLKIVK